MPKVAIYGAGGHAKVIIDILKENNINIKCLYDDDPKLKSLNGLPVLSTQNNIIKGPLIIGIGSNLGRKVLSQKNNVVYEKAISSSSIISPSAIIGQGTVVMQGAIIQSDTKVGEHCIINTGASVDHECIIANYVHISPHATLCGNVSVGEGTWIGAGAVVIPGIKIGKWCVIGAGSVVIKDIADNQKVVGNPARPIG